MPIISNNINVSNEIYQFFKSLCDERGGNVDEVFNNLASLVREFAPNNEQLLAKRDSLQDEIDSFFEEHFGLVKTSEVVKKLRQIGYIEDYENFSEKVSSQNIAEEITPMAGVQLVVPADKVNMVLNAANARWQSLYNSLYVSNIIDENLKDKQREAAVVKYSNDFLDKIVTLSDNISWNEVLNISYNKDTKSVHLNLANGKTYHLNDDKFLGFTLDGESLASILLENNNLKIELVISDNKIKDLSLETAITYIIDLEDASISAPENKYEGYRILKGIYYGTLTCEVRGELRKIHQDTKYICAKTLQEKTLKRTSLPLVREVGCHMLADKEIITIDGEAIPEKILDCFVTSFIGLRYHVAPKMHGKEEVELNVLMFDRINQMQKLAKNANKIGIMNEEIRTNAQLASCISKAKDIIFFTNTGFLDYTGSYIDLMMHQGAIAPYRELASKLYKTSYEKHNVNVSLKFEVPQIGAGMWAAIKDMRGLLKSKEQQVKGLTDTGWSPSPMAAGIHAMAFHFYGNVRQMQNEYKANIQQINIEDLFDFPAADLQNLSEKEIIENLDFAIHGLLAYAEPWVRRSIGCSGVKELSGEPLMEDRATARIKAAFVRNWLLHKILSQEQVNDSILRMAKLVDSQNTNEKDYIPLFNDALKNENWQEAEETVKAVYDVVFNPLGLKSSYVEAYFYPANRRECGK
jgi:malate synthase